MRKTVARKTRRGKRSNRRSTKRGGLWPFTSSVNVPAVAATNPGLITGTTMPGPSTAGPSTAGPSMAGPSMAGPNISNQVFAPKPGQFGYTDPNQVSLTGSFTEYQMGVPGFGVRGYTQPGANPFAPGAMQHVGLTGYPQLMGVAGLAMSQPKVQGSFNINQMPPDYYTPLGLVNKRTPFTKAELNAAYNQKKNLGTNADKKLVKNAYNTLSDPEKRYKHDTAMTEYFTAHPPSISDLLKMAPQRPGGPSSANILKGLSYMPPAISSQLNNPINPSQIQAR